MLNALGVFVVSAGEFPEDPNKRFEDGVCVAWILANRVDAGCKAGADSAVPFLLTAASSEQAADNINSTPRKTNK